MEIIATLGCKYHALQELSISLDGQKIVLNKEQCKTLFDVLDGKQGEVSKFRSKKDYSPYSIIRFSCEKPFNAYAVDSD